MNIENFFLRFAYPCAYIIMQRGELTEKELQELLHIAVENKHISRKRLEKVFFRAFGFIDELARKRGRDRWDPEVIKEYFYSYHNEVICRGEGAYAAAPKILKELSRVDTATVKKKVDDILIVEYNGKKRNVMASFIPDAKAGDKVRIHYGYAIEKIR